MKKQKPIPPKPEPPKEQPKRPEPDPNKTEDAFMKVWHARHGK